MDKNTGLATTEKRFRNWLYSEVCLRIIILHRRIGLVWRQSTVAVELDTPEQLIHKFPTRCRRCKGACKNT